MTADLHDLGFAPPRRSRFSPPAADHFPSTSCPRSDGFLAGKFSTRHCVPAILKPWGAGRAATARANRTRRHHIPGLAARGQDSASFRRWGAALHTAADINRWILNLALVRKAIPTVQHDGGRWSANHLGPPVNTPDSWDPSPADKATPRSTLRHDHNLVACVAHGFT